MLKVINEKIRCTKPLFFPKTAIQIFYEANETYEEKSIDFHFGFAEETGNDVQMVDNFFGIEFNRLAILFRVTDKLPQSKDAEMANKRCLNCS